MMGSAVLSGTGKCRFVTAVCGGLLLCFILFGLIGSFWLPGYAKNRLEAWLSDAVKRPVTIQRIRISPYTLSVAIEGLRAGDVFAVQRVHADFSLSSIFRRIPVLTRIDVNAPQLHLVRESESRLNVTDLIEAWRKRPKGPAPEFSINNISIVRGLLTWNDRVMQTKRTVSDISLGIPFISNVPSKVGIVVEPRFFARIDGAPANLSGRIRPFGSGQDAVVDAGLDNVDLLPAAQYVKLPVRLLGASLDTRLQIRFRRAQGAAPSLQISGSLRVHDVKLQAGRQQVSFSALNVEGINADPIRRFLSIQSVMLTSPALVLARNADARFDTGNTEADVSQPAGRAAKALPEAWTWSVEHFAVTGGSIHYEDATLKPVVPLNVTGLQIEGGKVTGGQKNPVSVSLAANVNAEGRAAVSGAIDLDGNADLNLKLDRVDLVALQGWAGRGLNILLTRGNMTLDGTAALREGSAQVKGNMTLHDFHVLDRVNAEDLLRWKSLNLAGLFLSSNPPALEAGSIDLRDFYAKVLINAQGRLNLRDVAPPAESISTARKPEKRNVLPDIRIGAVAIQGGTVNFSDHYVRPNYSVRITELSGRVDALRRGRMSAVELHGKVEKTAPLEISGRFDPLATPPEIDIKGSARGIDMPSFSSYSGRYLGYTIDKGKFSMDVQYHVAQGELTAENRLLLEQLSFGDKVESREALRLPVKLAVALLKNSRGEIDINLPVRGSLNDPEFSLGGVLSRMIVNLITKSVTSPFALLGSLFGGGKDLSQAEFSAGSADLTPDVRSHLESLMKAMTDRPGIRLEVTGMADPAVDSAGLQCAALERKLAAQKLTDEARQGRAGSLAETRLTPEERALYIRRMYASGRPSTAAGSAEASLDDMESSVLAESPVGASELQVLAEERGRRVQAWFAANGIEPTRVFLLAPKVNAGEEKSAMNRVMFSLR